MIPSTARRVPHQVYQPPIHQAPNAALLIDFDNVTMGIRSDLGKELKALLNSDVIRGKVAVQRAYADWRRYPQYIVPLAESSIDLIFAPAYGSAKKNATDLRMAIDAMELVFTRPEIGTFILLTGDSDFSSCVLKLKEYGKYVIGVGMRESSSDLLIQNCDEYYSYHALSGLTRAGDVVESKEDPWVLVRTAVQQMIRERDVMRTDRLKQVMIGLDPAFDEKTIGYSKFSKFVQEAEKKGLLQLRRGENGQQEIVPPGEAAGPSAEPARAVTGEGVAERRGNGRHRRGGRGAARGEAARAEPQLITPTAETVAETPAETVAETVAETAAEVPAAVPTPTPTPAPTQRAARAERTEPVVEAALTPATNALQSAYALLQQALLALAPTGHARDAELKRKMLELSPAFDEGTLGFAKFTRFLRQAHDAEVVDLSRVGEGSYEVSLGSRRVSAPTATTAAAETSTGRGRGGRGRGAARAVAKPVEAAAETAATPVEAAPVEVVPTEVAPVEVAPVEVAPAEPVAAPAAGRRRGARGGRAAAGGPPPLLPGQVIQPPAVARAAEPEAPVVQPKAAPVAPEEAPAAAPVEAPAVAPVEAPAAAAPAEPAKRSVRGRRGGRGRGAAATGEVPALLPGQVVGVESAPALPVAVVPVEVVPAEVAEPVTEAPSAAAEKPAVKKSRAPRSRGKRPAETAVAEAPVAPRFDAVALGLPSETEAARIYLATAYKGVGQKTADALVDDFGADAFRVLQEEPDRVRTMLGDRRAGTLLDHWATDFEQRSAAAAPPPIAEQPEPAVTDAGAEEGGDEEATRTKSRTRRGGRGRRKKKDAPAE